MFVCLLNSLKANRGHNMANTDIITQKPNIALIASALSLIMSARTGANVTVKAIKKGEQYELEGCTDKSGPR